MIKHTTNNKAVDWILNNQDNILVLGLATFCFPSAFLKALFFRRQDRDEKIAQKIGKACLTISFDCDYPQDAEAIPDLLGVLNKYSFKTSFACVGHWIEIYPNQHMAILDSGHEIVNHTYSHPDNEILNPGRKFKTISREEKKDEIERCHDICKRILKYEPIGCRIPHFKNLFTSEIYGILKELGYKYSSSTLLTNTKSCGFPFKTSDGVYEFPLSTCPKHPFTVFDTWHSFNSPRLAYRLVHRTEEEYVRLFKWLIDIAVQTNSYINIYIDPADIHKMKRLKEVLDYIRAQDIRVATYEEILGDLK